MQHLWSSSRTWKLYGDVAEADGRKMNADMLAGNKEGEICIRNKSRHTYKQMRLNQSPFQTAIVKIEQKGGKGGRVGGRTVVQAIHVPFMVDKPSLNYQVLRVNLLGSESPRRFVNGSCIG